MCKSRFKYFSIPIFCGEVSALKYIIRLKFLRHHIEPLFYMFECAGQCTPSFYPNLSSGGVLAVISFELANST